MTVRVVCGVFDIENGKIKVWCDCPDFRVYNKTQT
jgi:limonene-1,2-epoxide hydrolase